MTQVIGKQFASGESSSLPVGDAAALACGESGPAQPPPAPGHELITIHISADTASLLALIAAERGESLGSAVARLAVAEIERKGGIAKLASRPGMNSDAVRKGDCPSGIVARLRRDAAGAQTGGGAPAAASGDAAREAEQAGGIGCV